MFLLEPNRTQFDLNWRMFGIPVRVHPFFWVMAVLLGLDTLQIGPDALILWVACVFVSILVHELGHVCTGLLFGNRGHIVLYSFGGLAIGSSGQHERWKRIAVLFAGPLAGFVFLAAALAVFAALPRHWFGHGAGPEPSRVQALAGYAVEFLIGINLVWGLMNLLPVYPLDGGQISREVFSALTPRNGVSVSLWVSGIVAALLAVACLAAHFGNPLVRELPIGGIYPAIMFGLLAVSSFIALHQWNQQRRYGGFEEEERMPWERDPDYWKQGRSSDHDYWDS